MQVTGADFLDFMSAIIAAAARLRPVMAHAGVLAADKRVDGH